MGQKRQREGGAGGGGGTNKARWHDHSQSRGVALPIGKQGILVTVDSNDPRRATKEAIVVLEEAWEELVQKGPQAAKRGQDDPSKAGADTQATTAAADQEPAAEESNQGKEANDSKQEEGGAADFSALICSEVKDLKDSKKRPFVAHETGIKTCLFLHMPLVSSTSPTPNQVVSHVMRQAADTKVLRFRHCARLIPCTHICKPDMKEISKVAAAAVEASLDCSQEAESVSVAVLYEHRAAPKGLERKQVIDEVIKHVPRPPHTVKLKGASKTISVQVVRNACGISILDDYHELARYNVKEVVKEKEENEEKNDKNEKSEKNDKEKDEAKVEAKDK